MNKLIKNIFTSNVNIGFVKNLEFLIPYKNSFIRLGISDTKKAIVDY